MSVVLQVEDLYTHFFSREDTVKAVNGVNLTLREDSVLAVVGESGCGKSVTALSIMGLVPYPGRVLRGRVMFGDRNLLEATNAEMREVRGQQIGAIFQDPQASLNPIVKVGIQVEEALLAHDPFLGKKKAQDRSEELMAEMGLPDPHMLLDRFPWQLSGGMCQRIMLGIALAWRPKVLIADEPTSNLDTSVQAGILAHLRELKHQYGTAILLITHDMGIVAQMADEVAVLYAGAVVEYAPTQLLFDNPTHPYTFALFQSLPRLDQIGRTLRPLRGAPPEMMNLPEECPFMPRCPKATNTCRLNPKPELEEWEPGHTVACYNPVSVTLR